MLTLDDFAFSVRQTKDGGYILVGTTGEIKRDKENALLSCTDILLIKTDKNGNEQWRKTHGSSDPNSCEGTYSIEITDDGGYIIVGHKNYDVYVIKTNSEGNCVSEL